MLARLLIAACLLAPLPAAAGTLFAWTEAVGDTLSLRAVVEGACPRAEIDGGKAAMAPRAAADKGFPVTVCQTALPADARHVAVDGRALPLRPQQVNRILVIGDTGCRLKGNFVQDCNDPAAWPFASLAERAAAEHPDLIVHVGDYYYRETPCPAGRRGCAGSPYGDAWPAWSADFFTPVGRLLDAAPWIFVRGNHEQCGRGALGWFRFLDAGAQPLACPAAARPFAVTLGDTTLDVVDSADTEDETAPPDKVALFHGEIEALEPGLAAGHGWILTHRPIWGFNPPGSGEVGESDELPVNRTEQAAVRGENLTGIDLILSGHVHLFAAAGFGAQRPAQLIVGNGGDTRSGELPDSQAHQVVVAGLPAEAYVVERFGYLVLDRAAAGWTGTLRGVDGGVMARCTLAGRALACRGPAG